MDPVAIYKKLPRKNCGKCSAGTCMSFAVQFLRKMVRLDECTELDETAKVEIEAMLTSPSGFKERRF